MLSDVGFLLTGLGLGVTSVGCLWFLLSRKPMELRDMDEAEDFVNGFEEDSFLRLRSAVHIRGYRADRKSSGKTFR